jgi:hypothetical protein
VGQIQDYQRSVMYHYLVSPLVALIPRRYQRISTRPNPKYASIGKAGGWKVRLNYVYVATLAFLDYIQIISSYIAQQSPIFVA